MSNNDKMLILYRNLHSNVHIHTSILITLCLQYLSSQLFLQSMSGQEKDFDIEISDTSLEEIFKDEGQGEQEGNVEGDVEEMKSCIEVLQKIVPKIFNQELTALMQKLIIGKSKNHKANSSTQDELSPQNNTRVKLKRAIAKSFCEKGYGLELLKTQLSELNMTFVEQAEYHRILCSIIIQAFQKLEHFLKSMGYIQCLTVNPVQIEIVKNIGINCRSIFPNSASVSLFNTIKCMHSIDSYNAVTLQQSCQLYSCFKQNIKSQSLKPTLKSTPINAARPGEKKRVNEKADLSICSQWENRSKQQKFELHNRWNDQYEQLLLSLYKSDYKMNDIRKKFIEKYPNEEYLFGGEALRSKLCKIIRSALKNIMSQCQNFPKMPKLDDHRLRLVIYHHKAKEVRFQIIKAYEGRFHPTLLQNVVTAISNYINAQERQSYRCQRSRKERSEKWSPPPPPLYHPKFANGKKKYGKYNGSYDPNKVKMKFKAGEEYAQRHDEEKQDKRDCHSDNQSVYSIF